MSRILGETGQDEIIERRRDRQLRAGRGSRGRPDHRRDGRRYSLFYVANAQIGPIDPRTEGGSLAPVLVLKLPLGCRP